MKRYLLSFIAIITVLAFAHFVWCNTVFTHTHDCAGGDTTTHSHPYVPGQPHGHTNGAMQTLGSYNAAVAAFDSATAPPTPVLPEIFRELQMEVVSAAVGRRPASAEMRAPPTPIRPL